MRDDRERLRDIQEAIQKIELYANEGEDAFQQNELVHVWALYHLQIIGEATRALSKKLRERFPEVAWSSIISLRNILVHAYFDIDTAVIWNILQNDLPVLKQQIQAILQALEN